MCYVVRVTRDKKLRDILNVRLDAQLAREIERIAVAERRSESEVARSLLGYGIEVVRRLEATDYARPFAWREPAEEEPYPHVVEIQARSRPMTEEEIDQKRLRSYVGHAVDETGAEAGA
jgi:hypothetical protein